MRNLLILLPGPYLFRDHERYGIDILKKYFSVSVVDYTSWMNKNFWKTYSENLYRSNEHVVISCKEDFLNFVNNINNAIVLDNGSINEEIIWMRKVLKEKNSVFVSYYINLLPYPKINKLKTITKFLKLALKPTKFLKKLSYFFTTKISHDIAVLGGLASLEKTKAINKINAHCMDYDVYLKIKDKTFDDNNVSSYAVFLDQDFISHPDYDLLKIKKDISPLEYYTMLIKFLKKFSNKTKLKIKFAVHPKCTNKKLSNLLQGIDYSIHNTAELVKKSKVVLLHDSTSISYAVLFNKPTIMLTSDQLNKSFLGPRIKNLAKIVNSEIIHMDRYLNNEVNLKLINKNIKII